LFHKEYVKFKLDCGPQGLTQFTQASPRAIISFPFLPV